MNGIRKGMGLLLTFVIMNVIHHFHKAKKNILFVSCNGLKKNRVGRSVKMCVLCMYYVDWEFGG